MGKKKNIFYGIGTKYKTVLKISNKNSTYGSSWFKKKKNSKGWMFNINYFNNYFH